MSRRAEEKARLESEAVELLTSAYRRLGDAADCIRFLGHTPAIEEIGRAKACINNAKNLIGG
jgi:uncharacterized protein YerC